MSSLIFYRLVITAELTFIQMIGSAFETKESLAKCQALRAIRIRHFKLKVSSEKKKWTSEIFR